MTQAAAVQVNPLQSGWQMGPRLQKHLGCIQQSGSNSSSLGHTCSLSGAAWVKKHPDCSTWAVWVTLQPRCFQQSGYVGLDCSCSLGQLQQPESNVQPEWCSLGQKHPDCRTWAAWATLQSRCFSSLGVLAWAAVTVWVKLQQPEPHVQPGCWNLSQVHTDLSAWAVWATLQCRCFSSLGMLTQAAVTA
jgi:hypothetical protein